MNSSKRSKHPHFIRYYRSQFRSYKSACPGFSRIYLHAFLLFFNQELESYFHYHCTIQAEELIRTGLISSYRVIRVNITKLYICFTLMFNSKPSTFYLFLPQTFLIFPFKTDRFLYLWFLIALDLKPFQVMHLPSHLLSYNSLTS